MILETKRLILRDIAMSDAPAIQKKFPHWDIVRFLTTSVPWPYPPDGAEQFIRNYVLPAVAKNETHIWAITLKGAPDELIGVVELRNEDKGSGHLGFWLGLDYHRNGYMPEAVDTVVHYAFEKLGFTSLAVHNAQENRGSSRVQEKTGARRVSENSKTKKYLGGYESEEVWELTVPTEEAKQPK